MKYHVLCIAYCIIFLLLTSCFLIITPRTYGYSSQDDTYILHMQINTDVQDNSSYNPVSQISPDISQKKPAPKPSKNPISSQRNRMIPTLFPLKTSIQTGFRDQPSAHDFRFSISDDAVSFGPLSPTDFIARNITLELAGDPSYLYTVTGYENHELTDQYGDFIPNTRCDSEECNESTAGPWVNTLTFGLGYRCENIKGNDCNTGFNDKTFFKPFGFGNNNNGAIILSGILNTTKTVQILYQVNVSGTQHQGIYQNSITYVALPKY